jgi:hypothetical protein
LSCVVPETPVDLLDGRTLTLEEIKLELDAGKKVWVYSVDQETHQIKPGQVIWCGPTRKNAELVRVTLDNGMIFDTTPDHKWMLRDGTWCEAENLVSGASLMPVYKKLEALHGGCEYEKIYDPSTRNWRWTHQLMFDRAHKQEIDITAGEETVTVIHHKDGNRFNNNPDNLVKMGFKAHRDYHANSLAIVKKKALLEGKYNGLNNGWANKCRKRVEHLWSMQKSRGVRIIIPLVNVISFLGMV